MIKVCISSDKQYRSMAKAFDSINKSLDIKYQYLPSVGSTHLAMKRVTSKSSYSLWEFQIHCDSNDVSIVYLVYCNVEGDWIKTMRKKPQNEGQTSRKITLGFLVSRRNTTKKHLSHRKWSKSQKVIHQT